MTTEAFITGSRAYGTPRENSDLDLGVVVSAETAKVLRKMSESYHKVVFGQLNLVLFEDNSAGLVRYHAWKEVNRFLKSIAPVTKDTAIKALDAAGCNKDFSGEECS